MQIQISDTEKPSTKNAFIFTQNLQLLAYMFSLLDYGEMIIFGLIFQVSDYAIHKSSAKSY